MRVWMESIFPVRNSNAQLRQSDPLSWGFVLYIEEKSTGSETGGGNAETRKYVNSMAIESSKKLKTAGK